MIDYVSFHPDQQRLVSLCKAKYRAQWLGLEKNEVRYADIRFWIR